jgi:transposase InsO family protein
MTVRLAHSGATRRALSDQAALDWLLIFGQGHLKRVLGEFVSHYNTARPHRSINLDTPVPLQPVGRTLVRKPARR